VGAELEAILQDAPLPATDRHRVPTSEPRWTAFDTPTPELLPVRHNLPAQTTLLVGREAELAEFERLLTDSPTRLVTIVGPGGMGKTRISLEVASRFVAGASATKMAFPDGVIFVELAALNSVEQMITAVASAFGFAIERGLEPLQQIINFMSNKQLLLLLDNFEQLLLPDVNGAEAITAILQAAPDVKILVTSRQKLNLNSESVFALEGLAFPDWETAKDALSYSAVQLFVQSAQRVRYDFTLDDSVLHEIGRICRLTEGMPLGIVLAAAWIDMLSLAEIADEMEKDIDFLETEMGDLPPRQRSMRAVFDYSWALLSAKEQAVLARLSVFKGGFTREAAQAVTGASLRQLLRLVNKSLIQRDAGNGRFSIHELLRQMAEGKLHQSPDSHNTIRAYSDYFAQLIRIFWHDLLFLISPESMTVLNADRDNFRHAWIVSTQNGLTKNLTLMARPLLYFYSSIGLEKEAQSLFAKTIMAYSQQEMPETSPAMLTLRLCEAMALISTNPPH
jgi:predicted ATPase